MPSSVIYERLFTCIALACLGVQYVLHFLIVIRFLRNHGVEPGDTDTFDVFRDWRKYRKCGGAPVVYWILWSTIILFLFCMLALVVIGW